MHRHQIAPALAEEADILRENAEFILAQLAQVLDTPHDMDKRRELWRTASEIMRSVSRIELYLEQATGVHEEPNP